MLETVRKLIALLNRREKIALGGLLVLILLMSGLQVAGVGSIVPLVSLMVEADAEQQNPLLRWLGNFVSTDDSSTFFIVVGSITLGIILFSNAVSASTIWVMTRFGWRTQARLSTDLLSLYLSQPYPFFLSRNSADIGKNILTEMQILTNGVLLPLLRMIAFGTMMLFLGGFMIWFNPALAGVALLVVGGGYLTVFAVVRRRLSRAGERRMSANTQRFKTAQEVLGGVKEIKVAGTESVFIDRFRDPAHAFANAVSMQQILSSLPRYMIEALAFGSVLIVALLAGGIDGDLEKIVPVVTVYAFAGYRLLPAVQQVYESWSLLRFHGVVVDTVHGDFLTHATSSAVPASSAHRMEFNKSLQVENVSFQYAGAARPALEDVSLEIARGKSVALVGETGSGKTTLVDIMLGLLDPTKGKILVDGVPLTGENLRSWLAGVGYVPQDIYLTDDTLAANIALGVAPSEWDHTRIEHAARSASVHEFVQQLPRGYETLVGERGVRLSGGQRQRIGIARALYRNPDVLILDEATSNLDVATEDLVHSAIEQLAGTKTIILIAHRLSTTRQCDQLFVLSNGRVVRSGTYAEIVGEDGRIRQEILTA